MEIGLGGAAEYRSYRVAVRSSIGAVVYRREGLAAVKTGSGDKAITLTLPARLFAPGEYKVMLMGMADRRSDPVGEYLFRVTGKLRSPNHLLV